MVNRSLFTRTLWALQVSGAITPKTYLIGRALLRRLNPAGRCWPSLETLAEDIGCDPRTVSRAIASLRLHGLLEWHQRRARWNRMASNVYRLVVPKKREESILESSTGRMSDGSRSEIVEAALGRLGAALGCSPGAVMPWLGAT